MDATELANFALNKILSNHILKEQPVLVTLEDGREVKGYIILLQCRNNLGEVLTEISILKFEGGEGLVKIEGSDKIPVSALMAIAHYEIGKIKDSQWKKDN